MILTDYFLCEHDITWDYAKQCGIEFGTIRLPETKEFDITDKTHWEIIYKRFIDFGIKPIVIEPIPESLHHHIKIGDKQRDEAIEKLISIFPIMSNLGIKIICFNFMAHIGWLRTSDNIPERGGALVTGFNIEDFKQNDVEITEEQLWHNYEYFMRAILPEAERWGIKLALHPDDPPIMQLGKISRIMTSFENIKKAINLVPSNILGVTMCQACYKLMGEDLTKVITELKDKIFFIHFRNVKGNKFLFHETFHDNGDIPMADAIKLYHSLGLNVPIRVDHVPLMAGEEPGIPGYTSLGRLYAIGYLRGLLSMLNWRD